MAKNKNRRQGGSQSRAAQAEQAAEHSTSAATEVPSEAQPMPQGGPVDVGRKHQRRFGHN
jgi:hypothetical protein